MSISHALATPQASRPKISAKLHPQQLHCSIHEGERLWTMTFVWSIFTLYHHFSHCQSFIQRTFISHHFIFCLYTHGALQVSISTSGGNSVKIFGQTVSNHYHRVLVYLYGSRKSPFLKHLAQPFLGPSDPKGVPWD